MKKTKTQLEKLAALFEAGRSVTKAQAEKMGIQRLSARIYDLRYEHGMAIQTSQTRTGLTCYSL